MTEAIFTLLYSADYLAGALVLGVQLQKIRKRSAKSIVLGILVDKSQFTSSQLQLLARYYDELNDVSPTSSTLHEKLECELARPELNKTFTKIELWSLQQYEKILYLDSDTLPLVSESSSSSIGDLLQLEFDENKILAAPDSGFPDVFNSGVFVLKPSQKVYKELQSLVEKSKIDSSVSFDGADQGLLNYFFNSKPNWVQQYVEKGEINVDNVVETNNWIKIPFLFNVTPSAAYEYWPAFKHFHKVVDQPEPSRGWGPGEYDNELLSTFDTLNRYRSAAIRHVSGQSSSSSSSSSSSQIQVMHFIGPYKPWASCATAHGIHKDWLKVWIEEFGERSISDVVNEGVLPDTEKQNYQHESQHLVEYSPSKPISNDVHDEEREDEKKHQPTNSDPFSLLDPSRYQRFKDTAIPSIDAMWDATKEAPPKHNKKESSQPEHAKDNVFENHLKAARYHDWDQPQETVVAPAEKTENIQKEEQVLETYDAVHTLEEKEKNEEKEGEAKQGEAKEGEAKQGEAKEGEDLGAGAVPQDAKKVASQPQPEVIEQPELYGHRYIEPERVFNESSNFFPVHILQDLEKVDISQDSNTFVSDEMKVAHLGADVSRYSQNNEILEEKGLIETHGFDNSFTEDQTPSHIQDDEEFIQVTPKLFPWEFREQYRPERSFD
ncbi:GLG1 [Candida oxycetoniae]|uniref:GLG1 n=1 Tax=Candida oxycetoniae TaxID=497107 RepID=A0AAI9WYG8_9ASCO|nr:GLG1 [Candida oxycetoniae]KAI3405351.2 GLG1 [Candida oxycetoniae]